MRRLVKEDEQKARVPWTGHCGCRGGVGALEAEIKKRIDDAVAVAVAAAVAKAGGQGEARDTDTMEK